MKITYIVPHWNNIGDKIIWLGAKAQYEKRFPYATHELLFYNDEPKPLTTDILVVCGTPWLWDLCGESRKYTCLTQWLSLATCQRKEGIGLGACYPGMFLDSKYLLFQNHDECRKLKQFWSTFDYLTVRDCLAKLIFDVLDISADLQPCPAYSTAKYLKVYSRSGEDNILVYYDPVAGIGGKLFPEGTLQRWNDMMLEVVKRYEINKVIAITQHEADNAKFLDLPIECFCEKDTKNEDVTTVKKLLTCLAQAQLIVSPRIHVAIPAISLSKPTILIPVDSRYLSVPEALNFYEENNDVERLLL